MADFLSSLFKTVSSSDQGQAGVREFLDEGVTRLDRLGDHPVAQARIQHTLGTLYKELALPTQARPLLEDALETRRHYLGEKHPEVGRNTV